MMLKQVVILVQLGISLQNSGKGPEYTYKEPWFYYCLLIGLGLCIVGGFCSGLTVGYLSIDKLQLEMYLKKGDVAQKKAALKIMPIIQKHHVLLSTLLIANALALESLPIFIEKSLPSYLAIIVSTFGVVFIAEILPQAICTGPSQIKIAEACVPLIRLMLIIFGILAYPLGAFLDWLLGTHTSSKFNRRDLKAIFELHQSSGGNQMEQNMMQAGLSASEVNLIKCTIDLRDKPVSSIMIPIDKVFKLSNQYRLNQDTLDKISQKEFSRIPIYNERTKTYIVGTIKVKELLIDEDSYLNQTIQDSLQIYPALYIDKNTSLFQVLMQFQQMKTNICFIIDSSSNRYREEVLGLVSIKDLYEVLLNRELKDDDQHLSLGSQRVLQRLFSKDRILDRQPNSMMNFKVRERFRQSRA